MWRYAFQLLYPTTRPNLEVQPNMGNQSIKVMRTRSGVVERGWKLVRYSHTKQLYKVQNENGTLIKELTKEDIMTHNKHIRGIRIPEKDVLHKAKDRLFPVIIQPKIEKESSQLICLDGETCIIKVVYKVTSNKSFCDPSSGKCPTQKWTWVEFFLTKNIKDVFAHV